MIFCYLMELLFCYLLVDAPSGTNLITVPHNTTLLRDSSMSIHCSTNANPEDIEYQLYFKGLFIGNSTSGLFNITVMEDGVYTCVPINKVGTGDNATVSITVVGESAFFLCLTLLSMRHCFNYVTIWYYQYCSHN